MNLTVLKGRICNDIVLMNGEKGVWTQFTLAVPREYANGTDFIKVVAFKNIAKMIKKHSRKGDLIIVQGNLRSSQWRIDSKLTVNQVQLIAQFVDLLDWHKDPIDLPDDLKFIESLENPKQNVSFEPGTYEHLADKPEYQNERDIDPDDPRFM